MTLEIPADSGIAEQLVTYDLLNEALCRALFTVEMANRPVYLEITEEVQLQVSNELGIDPATLEETIFECVNSQIHHSDLPILFDKMKNSLGTWYRNCNEAVEKSNPVPSYPHIPLLLAFTISASDMGGEGGYSTNAYYPRLQGNLGLPDKKIVEESYRKVATIFWSALNLWLDKFLSSKRGIGTAYSISAFKYVGFALSQALVRSVDRKKLPKLFRENNFSPFTSLVERDMQNIIDAWMKREDSYFSSYRNPSKPLQKLWEKDDAKTRIASIACRELELWDGAVSGGHLEDDQISKQDFQVRLEAFETSFPSSAMHFNFSFSAPISSKESHVIGIKRRDGEADAKIQVLMDQSGWWRPDTSFPPVGSRDLLEGMLTVDIGREFNIERYPKRLVVFRHDELSRRYQEVERTEIGIRTLLAIQNNGNFVSKVSEVLSKCARPGWAVLGAKDIAGIPDGWVMAINVELVMPPENSSLSPDGSLEGLKPIFGGTLNFSGGFQLPGRPPKWHSDIDFEIRGSVLGAEKISMQICIEDDSETVVLAREFYEATGVWKIDASTLINNNYAVKLFMDSENKPVTEKTLRLRSSDSIDEASWKSSERLVHDFTDTVLGVVQTVPLQESISSFVDGSITKKASNVKIYAEEIPPNEKIWWVNQPSGNMTNRKFEQIALQSVTAASCFGTARHNFVIPPTVPSRSRQGFEKSDSGNIQGTCKYCGLHKKFAANPWVAERNKLKKENVAKKVATSAEAVVVQTPRVSLSNMPPVENRRTRHVEVLDGLMHVGGGSGLALEMLASAIDPGALFKYQFALELDQLALIDCRLDEFFQIRSWEVAPTSFASCGDHIVITGFCSKSLLESIRNSLTEGKIISFEEIESFTLPRIIGAKQSDIAVISNKMNIPYLREPVLEMLSILPPIAELVESLPKRAVPGFESISQFEPASNSWVETSNIDEVGGYRIQGEYRNRYVTRTAQDLRNNSVSFVSAELAKHFQAAELGIALLAFDYANKKLIVPLGATLPGLYGRSAVLASGKLPERDSTGKLLIYNNINSQTARLLAAKLGRARIE
ncbi:MAG: hypothetical protein F2781_00585 [Actinobacteria bacterium]|nr:hypothetical protein [Actinomycetota bacterium]MSY04531.1 hypothetical protein [Actinomycetota bacterium]